MPKLEQPLAFYWHIKENVLIIQVIFFHSFLFIKQFFISLKDSIEIKKARKKVFLQCNIFLLMLNLGLIL